MDCPGTHAKIVKTRNAFLRNTSEVAVLRIAMYSVFHLSQKNRKEAQVQVFDYCCSRIVCSSSRDTMNRAFAIFLVEAPQPKVLGLFKIQMDVEREEM